MKGMKMKSLIKSFLLLLVGIFIFAGCQGEAGTINENNDADIPDVDSDVETCEEENLCGNDCCTSEEECVDGICRPICETVRCQGICCEEGEECVNDMECLPECNTVRCGQNLTICCGSGEICLDGVVCAADCEEGKSLCGENLNFCCPANTVCLQNECVVEGSECDDNFDCMNDNWYCEMTIGRCLPLPEGEVCEGEPQFNPMEPQLEWYWPGIEYNGHFYQNIIASPVVGDVNGDGFPDIVVPVYRDSAYASGGTLLVVLDGRGDGNGNGQVLFTIPSADDPAAPTPYGIGIPALANFDDDPGLEIVYNMTGGGIRIADNDGIGEVCDATSFPGCSGRRDVGGTLWGGPSVSDLNGDGVPEVIIRCQALDGRDISNPSLDLLNESCGQNTVVADLNQDGQPEVVSTNMAYTINGAGGTPLWNTPGSLSSGFLAVADILPDLPGPEVISIYQNFYLLSGLTGELIIGAGGSEVNQNIPIPGSGQGGAPTVADFDGDGLPEISTAGSAYYVVYDPDCWDPPLRSSGTCDSSRVDMILWETPTQDLSSSRTGSSVFDFEGDGASEVLYNDECFFHIYDGITGEELVDPIIPSSSRTAAEYPLVADVDGDGNSEMIVISNADQAISRDNCHISWKDAGVSIDLLCEFTDCTDGGDCSGGVGGTCSSVGYQCDASGRCQLPGGTHGVRVYGDAYDSWVRTRPVWPQFSYHVTDFEYINGVWDVPVNEVANWTTYNNYRQNVQGGALFPVPDLSAELTATAICPSEVILSAVVHNNGSMGVPPGVEIYFYRTDTESPSLLGIAATSTAILPGGWERVNYVVNEVESDADMLFRVEVDEENLIEECDFTDNGADSNSIRCTSIE